MVFPWFFHGISMVVPHFPWFCHGFFRSKAPSGAALQASWLHQASGPMVNTFMIWVIICVFVLFVFVYWMLTFGFFAGYIVILCVYDVCMMFVWCWFAQLNQLCDLRWLVSVVLSTDIPIYLSLPYTCLEWTRPAMYAASVLGSGLETMSRKRWHAEASMPNLLLMLSSKMATWLNLGRSTGTGECHIQPLSFISNRDVQNPCKIHSDSVFLLGMYVSTCFNMYQPHYPSAPLARWWIGSSGQSLPARLQSVMSLTSFQGGGCPKNCGMRNHPHLVAKWEMFDPNHPRPF